MSFIYKYFTNGNATSAEAENTAALKAIIKDHKTVLKAECQQYEVEYKQALKDAEAEYKRAKQQAKENMCHNMLDAVKREVDGITATEAFTNADAKTKAKIEGFRTWINTSAEKHLDEKGGHVEVVDVKVVDVKEDL
ncbi:hypothetical protein BGX21_011466 [Mortierella sp. AD011]|nr:hypothetical protein BGX20_001382 [Mortierella sp. AD010]KAF9390486.1 hypothetical protein BGX21_011466 [Mortierella sp. AD011]